MRIFDKHWLIDGVARAMRLEGARHRYSVTMTPGNQLAIDRCTADHLGTGTRLIFTWDEGMHSSGWWKNPDYERCWHLSLSFREPETGTTLPKDAKLTEKWLDAFYGENCRYLWAEPPYSESGKQVEVWHYRIFCDPSWTPIVPRGEVYSREFTEAGWLSFSDMRHAHAQMLAELVPLPGEM